MKTESMPLDYIWDFVDSPHTFPKQILLHWILLEFITVYQQNGTYGDWKFSLFTRYIETK